MSELAPLIDGYGRVHNSLRISVTDRCNIRCLYCMPNENIRFKPRSELLSFEEMTRFVRQTVRLGVQKLRLTGGEPLVRTDVHTLVKSLTEIPEVHEIALTTNGLLLPEQAALLKQAGLHRLNISLDAMREETFRTIARRAGLDRVFAGIAAAKECGFNRIRLNAVAIRGLTEPEIPDLVRFAVRGGMQMRFIEFMPLDAEQSWQTDSVLSGEVIRQIIEREIGPLVPLEGGDPSQPARDFVFADGSGSVGFINPVTQPFCGDCNRLRITADGQLRNCLFSTAEWDARAVLRSSSGDERLIAVIRECVAAKKAAHGIDTPDFARPVRAMYQIGG